MLAPASRMDQLLPDLRAQALELAVNGPIGWDTHRSMVALCSLLGRIGHRSLQCHRIRIEHRAFDQNIEQGRSLED